MSRKKKITLEQEFEQRKADHKSQMIMYTLIKLSDSIYDSRIFKRYKNMEAIPIEGAENKYSDIEVRAYRVEEDLCNRAANGESSIYDKAYEFCWRRAKNLIVESIVV